MKNLKMLVVITAGSVTASSLDNYTSNFKFNTVSNGYGILKTKIGLLAYDEAVHARWVIHLKYTKLYEYRII